MPATGASFGEAFPDSQITLIQEVPELLDLSRARCLGQALVLALGLFAFPLSAFAAEDGILVTDPDELEALGFAHDAEHVYIAPGVDLEGDHGADPSASDADALVFAEGDQSLAQVPVRLQVWGKEFVGRENKAGDEWLYSGDFQLSRAGAQAFADAQIFGLPSGATLLQLRTWFRDALSTDDAKTFLFKACQPPAGRGPVVTTLIASATTFGGDGLQYEQVLISSAAQINDACVYFVRVRFDGASPSLALQKIAVIYRPL